MNLINPHHITCQAIVELVSDYLEGALPSREIVVFEEHLAFCGPCHVHLERLRRVRSATRKIAEEDVDPHLVSTLARALLLRKQSAGWSNPCAR